MKLWVLIIGLWLFFDAVVIGLSVYEKNLSLMWPFIAINVMYALLGLFKYRTDRSGL